MSKRQNNQLPNNLPQLQNLIKRDPESYKEEFLQQLRHFSSNLQVFELTPTEFNENLDEFIQYHYIPCHPSSIYYTDEEYNKKFNQQSNLNQINSSQIKVEIKQEVEDENKLNDSEFVGESYEDLNRQEEIFEIPRWPIELTANQHSQSRPKGPIGCDG